MSLGTKVQDPSDERIWAFDWSLFLAERSTTIASSSWVVPSGLTEVSESNTTTTATVKISGGTNKRTYQVTNTVVLANGERVEKSFSLSIRNQ